MKILIYHPAKLPVTHYGGTERVLIWLARGLKELGQEVWVMSNPGSLLPEGIDWVDASKGLGRNIPKGIEVVHSMVPIPWSEQADVEKIAPYVFTLHGNGKVGEKFPDRTLYLSKNHALRHGGTAYVYNGIDPSELGFRPLRERNSHGLFFSKTSWPVKNVWGAMKVSMAARSYLDIAGGEGPPWFKWFAKLHPQMRWIGPAGGQMKAELFARSRFLLFPVKWEEPFGLVMIEALMSGTPVLASNLGSCPEILSGDPQIKVGATLELPKNKETLMAWVAEIENCISGKYLPEQCRDFALRNFHYLRMAEGYLNWYKKAVTTSKF